MILVFIFGNLTNGNQFSLSRETWRILVRVFVLVSTFIDLAVIVYGLKKSSKLQRLLLYIPLALLVLGGAFTLIFVFFAHLKI